MDLLGFYQKYDYKTKEYMRKYILFAILMAIMIPTIQAQEKGYKGMVNAGWIPTSESTSFEALTIHGYQYNHYLFVGGGAGINYYSSSSINDEGVFIPIFADVRGYLLKGKISPYAEAKIGGLIPVTDGGAGVYFAPEAGCKFGFSSKFALNIAVEYILLQEKTGNNSYNSFYVSTGGLCVKIGVEF